MNRFQPGLHSHFPNGRVSMDKLQILAQRAKWMRMDVQLAEKDVSLDIFNDILRVGCTPIIVVWSGREAEWFPRGAHIEYQNERSINLGDTPKLPAKDYVRNFLTDLYPVTQRLGQIAYAGAAANFEDRDLNWYRDGNFKALPADVRMTIHHYWQGTNLQARIDQWRHIVGLERLWMITEFGAQGLTNAEYVAWLNVQWPLLARQQNLLSGVYYQISDSPTDDHDFGLYDEDGTLKQDVFDTFPIVAATPAITEGEDMDVATYSISKRESFAHPTTPGRFTTWYPKGQRETVLSIQEDGTRGTRHLQNDLNGVPGPWESWEPEGNRAVFTETSEYRAIPLVE